MCNFCKTIYDNELLSRLDNPIYENYLFMDENGISIHVDSLDPYESGTVNDIKFCPYCGRKLTRIKKQ